MTLMEVVQAPGGKEFVIEGRPPGLRRGGNDAASLVLDAAASVIGRLVKKQWQVEVRPWPSGRSPRWREEVADEATAQRRVEELVALVTGGGWPDEDDS